MLLRLSDNEEIGPSVYAEAARTAGLGIITRTLERSGPRKDGGGWSHQTIAEAIDNDGDMLEMSTCSPSSWAFAASSPTGRPR